MQRSNLSGARLRAAATFLFATALCALTVLPSCDQAAASPAPAVLAARRGSVEVAEAKKPPPAKQASSRWKAGAEVSAVWPTDGKWYDAVILDIAANGMFHVRYNDGIERSDITEKQIRARRSGGGGGGGSSVAASCPGPGLTRRCSGTCVNIQTDDNNCGGCGNHCASGKHCDGHMFCRDASGNL